MDCLPYRVGIPYNTSIDFRVGLTARNSILNLVRLMNDKAIRRLSLRFPREIERRNSAGTAT